MKRALVILAEGFEDLEATTITDLLVRGDIEVVSAGLKAGAVKGARHTVILPDVSLDQVISNDFDLIALPGGLPGADFLANDQRVLALVRRQVENNRLVGAICAAPRVLMKVGVSRGKRITCFPGALSHVDTNGTQVTSDAVCVDLPLVTSRGPGTAIDFTLKLIELLEGRERRDQVEAELVRD